MSFGQKPSAAWSRPQGAPQQQINPNLFTNQLGLAATGQAFSGIHGMPALNSGFAGLVNQAAFTNTMNMQNMLAQAQRQHQIMPAQQQVPQQARNPQQQQQQATSPTRSQRAFIGKVTKMMETYGFVDEDVFFQTNVIRGAMPRAGDRVMVEANYNPSMPFKWNASRVQLVQEATQQQPPARQPSQQQQNGSGGGSRWAERTAAAAADEPSRRRSPFTSKRHRSRSPPRRSSPRRRESPKRERDLPTKREREAEKEKERAASSVRGHSAKRDTADSPPRRRQRVIPRYFCNLPKMLPPKGEFKCADLRRRYTNLYVPSDFIRADFDWVQSIQLEQPLNFSPHPIQFNVLHKDVDIPLAQGEQMPPENPADADYRYVVKVLLISHPGLSVIRQKISGLSVDGSIDEAVETQSLTKSIHLLVGHKSKGEYMCIGGPWSPALDGPNPMAPQTLIKTAIRTTKSLTGLDLSNCSKWYKMVHLRYFRVERQRIDSVVLMLPDTSTITEFKVTEESYRAAEQLLRDQLAAKLSALEAEEFVPPGQNAPAVDELNKNSNTESAVLPNNDGENTNTDGSTTAEGANQQETEVNQTSKENVETTNTKNIPTSVPEAMDTTSANTQQSESDEQQQSETATAQSNASIFSTSSQQSTKKEVKTPWAKLEPIVRAMKVAELREELELRGLDSKGVKNILMQRLMDAIEKEKALDKENEGNNEAIQPQNEPNSGEEATAQSKEQQEGGGVEQVQQEQGNEQAEVPQQNAPEQQNTVVKEKESIMVKIKEEIIELMETDETTEEKKETPEEKEAREKAEKEQRELEKAKEKFEKGKKERKASLERHFAQIPKEPGIFVYPSKTAKSGKFDLKTMSLHSLLDYRLEDSKEASFEVFMFAEAIKEAFDRSNAFVVYHTISTALDKDEEKKRLNEALAEACKDEDIVCVDEGNGKKDAKDKDKDDKGSGEKPKSPTNTVDLRSNFKALVNNFDMFTAFVHFDTNVCGYLNDRDVEEIIYSIGLDLSRAEVQRLIKRLSSKDRVNYRNLTDKWVDKEGECKYTPKPTYENLAQSYAEHAKGHFQLKMLDDNSEKEPQQMEVDESGIIFYKGTVVNVKHCLERQMLMEQERQNVLDANNQLEMQLKASKDQCGQLEKKKRRLEDDVDRYKKKLHDTEKSLRKEQEDYSAAKKALQDCKRYGERITGIVEKIMPPPKPKETSSEKERDKNASKEKEKEALDGIVLIDEAVANPEKEDGNEETAENAQEQQQSSKSQDEMDTNNATTGEDAVNGKQNEQEVEAQMGTENDEEKQQE